MFDSKSYLTEGDEAVFVLIKTIERVPEDE
jgi:hypothetical protein